MKISLADAKTTILAVAIISMTEGGGFIASMPQVKILDTIQGANFLAIRSAMSVFLRRKVDVADYKITLVRDKPSPVVVFAQKDGQGAEKTVAVRQGSNAELSGGDLKNVLANINQLTVLDTLQGTSFPPIQAALPVFQQNKLDLAEYKITVVGEGNSTIVAFTDKDAQPGSRGAAGARLGFEVEVDPRNLSVRRSNFIR